MTKARTNATTAPAVGRNMVINGAMNVAQRATSVTGLGANAAIYPTCDRWMMQSGSTAGRYTMTQTADGPNGISANCIKLDCTTADTSIAAAEYLNLEQRLEGQNVQRIGKGVAGAKQFTLSFYVKASAAFTFGVELDDKDNGRQITKLFATTTDWVRHSFVIPVDEDDGSSPFDDDNAASLAVAFWLHAGTTYTGGTLNTATFANKITANRAPGIDSFFSSTDNNFFLTGLQLEVGPVATEFEQEDISITLHKCYRYFQKIAAASGAAYKRFGIGQLTSTTTGDFTFPLETTLRDLPAIVTTGTAANYAIYHNNTVTGCSAVPIIDTGTDQGTQGNMFSYTGIVGSGLTVAHAASFLSNNNTSAFLSLDAEL
jgi:hypothetical protein